jgi:hypothetical protein
VNDNSALRPPRPDDPPPIGEPGVLEQLAEQAALPTKADEVEVPYEFPDRATLERALFAIAPVYGIEQETAQQLVGKTVESRAEPYRRPDGSYRFENRFRSVIAMAP